MPLRSKVEKAVRKIVKGQIEANKTGCKSKKRHNWQLIGGHQEPHKLESTYIHEKFSVFGKTKKKVNISEHSKS